MLRPSIKTLLAVVFSLTLINCGGPAHSPDEKYYVLATNLKVPY